jgi:hypothetical protein
VVTATGPELDREPPFEAFHRQDSTAGWRRLLTEGRTDHQDVLSPSHSSRYILTHVAVVVPFRGGCPHRERAWHWVRERYRSVHPEWEVIEAPAPEGPWSKGGALNPAIRGCDAQIVIQADADVWCDGLERAVYALVCGQASWAMPHKMVHRLGEKGTAAILAGAEWREQKDLAQRPYPGLWGGGILAARRDVLVDCPMDSRFQTWGQADESWAIALRCLYGKGWRGTADLVHLFHPPAERESRRHGSKASRALHGRYRKARRDPEQMRALIAEAEEDSWASTTA